MNFGNPEKDDSFVTIQQSARTLDVQLLRNGTEGYILKCDVRKYFDSVDHEVLKWQLRREVEAKVIYGAEEDRDILNQYIIFSRVFDEQMKIYEGDRAKAVQETIRICKEKNVLNEYLAREEAAAIMYAFASQVDAVNEALMTEREEGRGEGMDQFATLMDKLLAAGRMEDVQKAVKDKVYRDGLLQEFHIN